MAKRQPYRNRAIVFRRETSFLLNEGIITVATYLDVQKNAGFEERLRLKSGSGQNGAAYSEPFGPGVAGFALLR